MERKTVKLDYSRVDDEAYKIPLFDATDNGQFYTITPKSLKVFEIVRWTAGNSVLARETAIVDNAVGYGLTLTISPMSIHNLLSPRISCEEFSERLKATFPKFTQYSIEALYPMPFLERVIQEWVFGLEGARTYLLKGIASGIDSLATELKEIWPILEFKPSSTGMSIRVTQLYSRQWLDVSLATNSESARDSLTLANIGIFQLARFLQIPDRDAKALVFETFRDCIAKYEYRGWSASAFTSESFADISVPLSFAAIAFLKSASKSNANLVTAVYQNILSLNRSGGIIKIED